jgi:hypothetical protein
MSWTRPSRDKTYGLDKAQQRQNIWAEQGPVETRDMSWKRPSRDETYWLDKAQQRQEI